MELDEVIKYFQNKVMDLEAEFYDTTILYGLHFTKEGRASYLKSVEALRQIADWLTELKRLQSMGSHLDGYETEDYVFSYYESKDLIGITVYNVRADEYFVEHIDLSSGLSHDEFVKMCNEYTLSKENQ